MLDFNPKYLTEEQKKDLEILVSFYIEEIRSAKTYQTTKNQYYTRSIVELIFGTLLIESYNEIIYDLVGQILIGEEGLSGEDVVNGNVDEELVSSLIASGVSLNDLVVISTHANCSKMCQPYQGRVFSAYGLSSGYMTISEATSGGLFHYGYGGNCKHFARTYQQGMEMPKMYDNETIEKARALSEKMRYNERKIRYWKLRGDTQKINEWLKRPHDPTRI